MPDTLTINPSYDMHPPEVPREANGLPAEADWASVTRPRRVAGYVELAAPSTAATKRATTSGSNCVPAHRCELLDARRRRDIRPRRYGRSLVIASNASATAAMRASSGIAVPAQPVGDAASVEPLVMRAHDVERDRRVAEQRRAECASRPSGCVMMC